MHALIEGKEISPHKLGTTYGTQIYEKHMICTWCNNVWDMLCISTSKLYIRGQKNEGRKHVADIMGDIIIGE